MGNAVRVSRSTQYDLTGPRKDKSGDFSKAARRRGTEETRMKSSFSLLKLLLLLHKGNAKVAGGLV